MTNRRNFIKQFATLAVISLAATSTIAKGIIKTVAQTGNDFRRKVIDIIESLRSEGSNVVKKVMNGKTYAFDPYTHYPCDGGIADEKTGYRIFFHAHRPNEYGHFHTFATDENGDLVHLILISMSEEGKPIGLATVNRWVTGDKYVKADVLKKLSENFFVNPSLFKDPKAVEFVNHVFKAYKGEINQLYNERDRWIINYVNNNYREPFEDREYEILSERIINLY